MVCNLTMVNICLFKYVYIYVYYTKFVIKWKDFVIFKLLVKSRTISRGAALRDYAPVVDNLVNTVGVCQYIS